MRYLAVDFGSTYTKLTAMETQGDSVTLVGTAMAFTTIATDVRHGFDAAMERLQAGIGPFAYDKLLCCSSAGGGLTMVALGLVPELTSKAAKMAAESAGAKVMRTYAYEVSAAELEEIAAINPDIVLLCGGTDGGNKEVIIRNAHQLASLSQDFAVIVAGNKSADRELAEILKASGKRHVITANVMPAFGKLNIEPARECIRQIFIERIVDAKGLSRIQAMSSHPIIPTPLAVLNGCELLSSGTAQTPGMGDFMALDVGGATTDVYSLSKGAPSLDNVLVKGLPEPYAKRTVEGDLGMRYSAPFLLENAGANAVAHAADVSADDAAAWVTHCNSNPETCAKPDTPGRRVDEALAGAAMSSSLLRHCGVLEQIFTPLGEIYTLTGKDLSEIPLVIGIGGILQNSVDPAAIFYKALNDARSGAPERMLPRNPIFCMDSRYIFSAMGLLGSMEPELALSFLKNEFQPLREKHHGVAE